MNTHSWDNAVPPSNSAGTKERAGLTEVPSNGTATRWQAASAMPMARPAKPAFSVRLVTTDWHMPRARFEIARQLPDGVKLVGDAVESNPRFTQLFTEYNKYLLRRFAVVLGI